MNRLLLAPLVLLLIVCDSFTQPVKGEAPEGCKRSVSERLRDHFDDFEVPASVIVNNVDTPPGPSARETIQVGKYTLEWIAATNGPGVSAGVSVRIDGTSVSISQAESLNAVDGGKKVKLNFVDRWDQIRLYSSPEGDLLTISMSASPCTGTMCSAGGQLIYDVRSKRASHFSTFAVDPEVRMFAFNRGNLLPLYLSKSFEGDFHGNASSTVTYELFEPDSGGQFVRSRKGDGKHFYLKHRIEPEASKKVDTLKEDWPVDVGCRRGF